MMVLMAAIYLIYPLWDPPFYDQIHSYHMDYFVGAGLNFTTKGVHMGLDGYVYRI